MVDDDSDLVDEEDKALDKETGLNLAADLLGAAWPYKYTVEIYGVRRKDG